MFVHDCNHPAITTRANLPGYPVLVVNSDVPAKCSAGVSQTLPLQATRLTSRQPLLFRAWTLSLEATVTPSCTRQLVQGPS